MSNQNYFECDICHDGFDNLKDYTNHIREMSKEKHPNVFKVNDEFETSLFRDLSKLLPSVLIGMISFLVVFFTCIWQFPMTVIGPHCMESTSYSIAQWIFRSLTIQC